MAIELKQLMLHIIAFLRATSVKDTEVLINGISLCCWLKKEVNSIITP